LIDYQIEENLCEVNLLKKIYVDTAKILKAISEPKRLRIVDMLSCRELCACEILEEFHITQPTLSHDMKLLVETGMVQDRREGKNIYYSLNQDVLQELQETLKTIFTSNPDCICHSKSDGGCK
jgi:ArsR family transcriptional regulator